MSVEYNHAQNIHSVSGPRSALPFIFSDGIGKSLLDIGCGTGTWLRAASDLGVSEVFGIDGIDIPRSALLIDPKFFKRCDLTAPVDLGRKFEMALCLEVAEHLDAKSGRVLVETLVKHSDKITFSAACPGQPGQHHVNCQWPEYWQELFNLHGYRCDDSLRWQMWSDQHIEPWYRQNVFSAVRDASGAGKESRIKPVIHPDVNSWIFPEKERFEAHLHQIEDGQVPLGWYFKAIASGITRKLRRHI